MCGDNVNQAHEQQVVNESVDGIRVVCRKCHQVNVVRFDTNGRCDNRSYSRLFKQDLVQPGTNLYSRLHPESLSIS